MGIHTPWSHTGTELVHTGADRLREVTLKPEVR